MGNRWLESVRSGYGVLEIMFGSFVTVAQALNQIVFRDETRGIRSRIRRRHDRRKRFPDSQTKTVIPMESENPRLRNRGWKGKRD